VLGAVLAPRMPVTGSKAKTPKAITAAPPKAISGPDPETTQVVPKQAAVKDRKSMMILPQPSESTIVLPRIKELTGRDEAVPTTGNGQATTYKSSVDANGSDGPSRLRVALDSGEDLG